MALAWIVERDSHWVNQAFRLQATWGAWFAYRQVFLRAAERGGDRDPWVASIDDVHADDDRDQTLERPPRVLLPQSRITRLLLDAIRSEKLPARAASSPRGRREKTEAADWWSLSFDFPLQEEDDPPVDVVARAPNGEHVFFEPTFAKADVMSTWPRIRLIGGSPRRRLSAEELCEQMLIQIMADDAPRNMTNEQLWQLMKSYPELEDLSGRGFDHAKKQAQKKTGNKHWRKTGPIKKV